MLGAMTPAVGQTSLPNTDSRSGRREEVRRPTSWEFGMIAGDETLFAAGCWVRPIRLTESLVLRR